MVLFLKVYMYVQTTQIGKKSAQFNVLFQAAVFTVKDTLKNSMILLSLSAFANNFNWWYDDSMIKVFKSGFVSVRRSGLKKRALLRIALIVSMTCFLPCMPFYFIFFCVFIIKWHVLFRDRGIAGWFFSSKSVKLSDVLII